MTLDYKKMFLNVTEEAVVKGHFIVMCKRQSVTGTRLVISYSHPTRSC